MARSLEADYENGVVRPLEPVSLQAQATVTVSDASPVEDWVDAAFLNHLERQADDSVTLEHVRSATAKIRGSMVEEFRKERDERI